MFEKIFKKIKCKMLCCFKSKCSLNEDNKENNQKQLSNV